jgi:acetyltransferase-like isoleucine patch superfamily enzyme
MKSRYRIILGDAYYATLNQIIRVRKAFILYIYNGFITKFPSYFIRTLYLRFVLKIKIGKNTSIHMGCYFAGNNVIVGNNSVIARDCYLDGRVGLITIGNNVSISPETAIISMTHLKDSSEFSCIASPVVIEDYCWTGMRSIILPGVVMSKGSIAGAGSVVTKSVLPYHVVAGNPAKIISTRSKDLNYELNYFPFFNTDI